MIDLIKLASDKYILSKVDDYAVEFIPKNSKCDKFLIYCKSTDNFMTKEIFDIGYKYFESDRNYNKDMTDFFVQLIASIVNDRIVIKHKSRFKYYYKNKFLKTIVNFYDQSDNLIYTFES